MVYGTPRPHRIPVTPLVVVGLIVLTTVIAGVFSGCNQKDTRLTSEDKMIADKIKAGNLTSQDLEKIVSGGISEYNKLTGETAKPTAPTREAGSWVKTFGTINGRVVVRYIETASAKGKVNVWISDDQWGTQNVRNVSSKSITFQLFTRLRNEDGTIRWEGSDDPEVLEPGEVWDDGTAVAVWAGPIEELWVEVE